MSENTTAYKPGKHGPILIDTKEEINPKYLERETFFKIDNDEYTILKNPSPAMGLEFLEIVRLRGEIVAVAAMFEEMVQPSGALRRLSKVKNLNEGTVEALMSVVQDKLIAVTEQLTGN
jgi:hypothetical protein